MNRNALRTAAVSAVAALTLGAGAGLASASITSAATPQSVSAPAVAEQAAAQHAARTLLGSSLAGQLTAVERTELSQIADGKVAAASKWSAIRAAFSKVSGFGRAIAGKYSDFKKWYDDLPLLVRLPLAAVSPGLTLLEIYNALH
ncbi:hypothetical protein [Streptomyces acidiscabies]|uniref:Uncharacterized protein n=1 Tax=Streptomyces acidiscabies TaxID=42234 RepID=A0A0L0K9H1_9ACTN|nr:hypothetical protein [Streptomyces acidiscabies]KND34501.1 hypothetical protein IQ63_16145 [Streptomyces acidiscabies]